jgi:uncharacterized membrane protein
MPKYALILLFVLACWIRIHDSMSLIMLAVIAGIMIVADWKGIVRSTETWLDVAIGAVPVVALLAGASTAIVLAAAAFAGICLIFRKPENPSKGLP